MMIRFNSDRREESYGFVFAIGSSVFIQEVYCVCVSLFRFETHLSFDRREKNRDLDS